MALASSRGWRHGCFVCQGVGSGRETGPGGQAAARLPPSFRDSVAGHEEEVAVEQEEVEGLLLSGAGRPGPREDGACRSPRHTHTHARVPTQHTVGRLLGTFARDSSCKANGITGEGVVSRLLVRLRAGRHPRRRSGARSRLARACGFGGGGEGATTPFPMLARAPA